jgi:3-hydroxybutyryl-CoA dehydrogenase
MSDFTDCGLVIEAVIEDLAVKQSLFRELEGQVNDKCILGTNTSSLSIAAISSAVTRPENVIGIHFFNPPVLLPLVEVIPGISTDPTVSDGVMNTIESWGKVVVKAKDTPGFIVNRVARPFYGEAVRIYEEGIATPYQIDTAMKSVGFRMGPFELMDFIGHDVNYRVTETVWEQMFYDPRYKPSFTQKRLFESGFFGRKSGRGFYKYQDGKAVADGELPGEVLTEKITSRILCMLINEAADALYLGIASRDHIDLAMTNGVNYPKGLLRWCDEIGVESVLEKMQELRDDYQEDRYRPSVLLKKMAASSSKFYS